MAVPGILEVCASASAGPAPILVLNPAYDAGPRPTGSRSHVCPMGANAMSRVCQVTGKKAMVGNSVSHANNKSKRRFEVNLQTKRYYFDEEKRWITLRLSTEAMKLINRRGISAIVREMRASGRKV